MAAMTEIFLETLLIKWCNLVSLINTSIHYVEYWVRVSGRGGYGVIGGGLVSGSLHPAADLLSHSIPRRGDGKHK